MYTVLTFDSDEEDFWLDDELRFSSLDNALAFATESGQTFEIYKDCELEPNELSTRYELVARSTYDLWSR